MADETQGNIKGTNIQDYGIAEAMSEMMNAAIEADAAASERAYEMIRRSAYGQDLVNVEEAGSGSSMKTLTPVESEHLAMAYFSMQDTDGNTRQVGIPKITMMPIPMLHVKEVEFGISLKVNFDNTRKEKTELKESEMNELKTLISQGKSMASIQHEIAQLSSRMALYSRSRRSIPASQQETLRILKSQLALFERQQQSVSTSSMSVVKDIDDDTHLSSTTTLELKVKMEQAELPSGVKQLLQTAANNVEITQ